MGIHAESQGKSAWQVSQGAEINFMQAQRLLEELFQHPNKRYTGKDFAEILGYAEKKRKVLPDFFIFSTVFREPC